MVFGLVGGQVNAVNFPNWAYALAKSVGLTAQALDRLHFPGTLGLVPRRIAQDQPAPWRLL
jgi:hypothetical protein